ncbi:MAG: class I SAM-dependent methyltransferase [Candidatus Tectimicrobiota bacterium]
MHATVDQEIRELIHKHGRITFAQFMQTCLYSPHGGFYAARSARINTHFGTSPTSHPAFGTLIARQLEQMWHLLGDPPVFHVLEVGCGDGALAQAIVQACTQMASPLAQALHYVAADYAPRWSQAPDYTVARSRGPGDAVSPGRQDTRGRVQRVRTAGLQGFRQIVGCILCNELIDNFPVHRFAIQHGRVKEVFVTLTAGQFTEVLDEPSSPRIAERLASVGVFPATARAVGGQCHGTPSLPEGFRGEVNLAVEDWTGQLASALERGFVLTIDYGQLAPALYAPRHNQGTLMCYHRHVASHDPYQHLGQQDITCQVDFTSLMRLGEQHGLATAGYTLQRQFLMNLGFASLLEALQTQGLSAARLELSRMAMMTLVDPDEYGDFKVLAQAKGQGLDTKLLGFQPQAT